MANLQPTRSCLNKMPAAHLSPALNPTNLFPFSTKKCGLSCLPLNPPPNACRRSTAFACKTSFWKKTTSMPSWTTWKKIYRFLSSEPALRGELLATSAEVFPVERNSQAVWSAATENRYASIRSQLCLQISRSPDHPITRSVLSHLHLQVGRNLFAVKTPVFDKDLARPRAGNNHSGHIDTGHVAFECIGIAHRPHLGMRQFNSQRLQKFIVRMVSGQGKHKIVLQRAFALRRLDPHRLRLDLQHAAVEVCGDFAFLDPVLNVGLDPVLHVAVDLRPAMHHAYPRSAPPQLQRRNRGGILGPDNEHVHIKIRVRLFVIMQHLAQFFTGNAQVVRQIVISRGCNDLS